MLLIGVNGDVAGGHRQVALEAIPYHAVLERIRRIVKARLGVVHDGAERARRLADEGRETLQCRGRPLAVYEEHEGRDRPRLRQPGLKRGVDAAAEGTERVSVERPWRSIPEAERWRRGSGSLRVEFEQRLQARVATRAGARVP